MLAELKLNENGVLEDFDCSNWDHIKWATEHEDMFETPWTGTNTDGETVLISACKDYVSCQTLQDNGWIRENRYYPDDYSVEEMYIRG